VNINLHHLELFYYVAEAEGISNAVKVMPYSIQQPAISQQIVSLEKYLGVKLFERRPFSLTDAGRVLLAVVAPFMEKLATIEDELRDLDKLRLRLGCASIIAEHYIPEILPGMMEKFPNLMPVITEVEGKSTYRELISGDLDLVISSEPLPRSKKFKYQTLLTIPYRVIVKKDSPLVDNFQWTESCLDSINWVALQEDSLSMNLLRQEMRKHGCAPVYGALTNTISSALKYIALDLGAGFMITPPKFLLEQHNLVALDTNFNAEAEIGLAWREKDEINEVLIAFIDLAQDLIVQRRKDFLA
jgi:DNA-binding transcriptional LysR family regulator